MYRHHPQTKRLRALIEEGAIGEVRLIRSAFSYSLYDADNIRLRTEVEGGGADGRRLLLRQRLAARGRRRAGVGLRLRVVRAVRHRLGLHRLDAVPRRRARDVRLRHRAAEPRRARGRSAARARSSWTTPGTRRAGDRAPHGRQASSGSRSSTRTRTGSSSRTSPTRRPARPSCCSAATTRWARRGRSPPSTARRRAASPSRSDGAGEARARGGDARRRRDRAVAGRAGGDRDGGLRARRPRAVRPSDRRLREHGAGVREGARPLPGPDVPRAPTSAGRRRAGQGGNVPRAAGVGPLWWTATGRSSSARATSTRSRPTRSTGSGRATRARSSPSSRRGAATRRTCSRIRASCVSDVDSAPRERRRRAATRTCSREWQIRNTTIPNRVVFAPTCPTWVADPYEGDLHRSGGRLLRGAGEGRLRADHHRRHGHPPERDVLAVPLPGPLGRPADRRARARSRRPCTGTGASSRASCCTSACAPRRCSKTDPAYDFDATWYMVAPSQVPPGEYPNAPMPKELEEHEIEEILGWYEAAARRAIAAGLDGVEFHMSHGYLPWQFLSPLYNHRSDRWGGSYENRLRFPVEAMSADPRGDRRRAVHRLPDQLDLVLARRPRARGHPADRRRPRARVRRRLRRPLGGRPPLVHPHADDLRGRLGARVHARGQDGLDEAGAARRPDHPARGRRGAARSRATRTRSCSPGRCSPTPSGP